MAKRQKEMVKVEKDSMVNSYYHLVKQENDSKVNSYYHLVKQENDSTVNSSYHLVKREKNSKDGIDRMSILPDKLLVSILSLLPLKEATATSILSRRWRYLWTLLPKLDFDGTEFFLKVKGYPSEKELDEQRCNYVGWVDDVISARGPLSSIEEFRVFFNLTKAHKSHIDKWLRYAVADNKRKIRKLELKLVDNFPRRCRRYDECYTFPDELLLYGNKFEFLRSISLEYVNVSGEALEFLLRSSRQLEELSVCQSGHLSALKIISPFPSFKRLEISCCVKLKWLEIRDAKIVYLKYRGSRIPHFVMENVPLLVELCIGGPLTEDMFNVLAMFESYLPQLEIFKMNLLFRISWEETAMFCSEVTMKNLKQLVVAVWVSEDDSLLPLTNFIRASPCLQKFVLEALVSKSEFGWSTRERTEIVRWANPCLEVVQFTGYRGSLCELELMKHLLENVVGLKEIRVDPHLHNWYATQRNAQNEITARSHANNQLTQMLPPNINLNIL